MGQAGSSGADGASGLVLVGITHREARVEVRERVHLDRDTSSELARVLVDLPGVREAVVLSTCNRTELYLHGPAPDSHGALRALAAMTLCEPELLERFALRRAGMGAARHLLSVTAGLESRITGELQVLGQVRTAIATALAAGTAGPNLAGLFRFAVAAGRRAQRASATAPPSLERLAVRAGLPDVMHRPSRAIVLGTGAVARRTTDELRRRGVDYLVCGRRPDRAAELAASPDDVLPFVELIPALATVDLLVCATAARSPLVQARELEGAISQRTARSLTIVDLCLPRAVEPEVPRDRRRPPRRSRRSRGGRVGRLRPRPPTGGRSRAAPLRAVARRAQRRRNHRPASRARARHVLRGARRRSHRIVGPGQGG